MTVSRQWVVSRCSMGGYERIWSRDLGIAAHAKAGEFVLVTNNEKEFRRMGGLRIENWAARKWLVGCQRFSPDWSGTFFLNTQVTKDREKRRPALKRQSGPPKSVLD